MDGSRLAAIPLFHGLDDEALTALAAVTTECEAPSGKVVVSERDFGHAMYAIESGTADVVCAGEVLQSLGPGDVFGEVAVIATGRRTASVVATSPMKMITLFKRDVWALEREAPDVAATLRQLVAERQVVRRPAASDDEHDAPIRA
jgi:CRP-like cAMP-binding protein